MDLKEYIAKADKPLIIDGGMGTQLDARGAFMGGQACLSYPETVLAVHQDYLAQGVNLLITNTLTMNRYFIELDDEGIDIAEVNLAGARLARQAADGAENQPVFVLGDMSATGKMLEPLGDLTEEMALEAYKEQAGFLAEGGVDGFIIETMFSIEEMELAIQACKEVADIPVFASMTFETLKSGGRTMMGNTAEECARRLEAAGADVVGANCGSLSPLELAEIVKSMAAATSLPIIVQPNAGKPRLEGTTTYFDLPPDEFAEGMALCLANGASIIGGCCGTTPAHIKTMLDDIGK
ncbi:MAG TPA: homocysteine S-methyltransferase family protein [Anaerolineales bacterium]|nr:homocysteine S-methyltransferase family protein [Anaerolineales bacterium]